MLIDIVILPPENIRKKIGKKIKKEIGNFSNFFVVDNIKLFPHLSLWHMRISKIEVNNIAKKLKQIAKGQKQIKISSSGFHTLDKYKGCIEFGVKRNKSLIQLQHKIFQNIYSYKLGIMPQFASFLGIIYPKEKLQEIKKYGRSLGFTPHFTMGWLKNEENLAEVIRKMREIKFSFLAKEIYICEIDKWWQVKKIIKKINF